MKTQLVLRLHKDVTTRHEQLLLHADAHRLRVVALEARGQAWLQRVPVVVLLALAHHKVRARDHDLVERPSLRRASSGHLSARTGDCLR